MSMNVVACPTCEGTRTRVLPWTPPDREADGSKRRSRECQSCGERFYTVERAEAYAPSPALPRGRPRREEGEAAVPAVQGRRVSDADAWSRPKGR